jgi:thymidylate synthase
LGELWWYLAKTNNLRFITYYVPDYRNYSDDGRTIYGAYGPRLFNMKGNDQIANVLNLLKTNPHSRRAVIQLFDASDIAATHKDIPCTCTLQFMLRDDRLLMFTNMRSNDAFLGLPHDVFAFTMLQEIIARSLSVELGPYKHAIGSLHLYDENKQAARQYLEEGWQSTAPMPPMPKTDPWPSIEAVLNAESALRLGRTMNLGTLRLDCYWKDLVRLLQIYRHFKKNQSTQIARLKRHMSVDVYHPYIEDKRTAADKRAEKGGPK